jgi:hypothetical protein
VAVVLPGNALALTAGLTAGSTAGIGGRSTLEAAAVSIAVAGPAVESAGSISPLGFGNGATMGAVADTALEARAGFGGLADGASGLEFALGITAQAGHGGSAGIAFLAEGKVDNAIPTEPVLAAGHGNRRGH